MAELLQEGQISQLDYEQTQVLLHITSVSTNIAATTTQSKPVPPPRSHEPANESTPNKFTITASFEHTISKPASAPHNADQPIPCPSLETTSDAPQGFPGSYTKLNGYLRMQGTLLTTNTSLEKKKKGPELVLVLSTCPITFVGVGFVHRNR